MMDLYEAIEVVSDWINTYEQFIETDNELIEAMKIVLDAARDKAGV